MRRRNSDTDTDTHTRKIMEDGDRERWKMEAEIGEMHLQTREC